MSRKKEIKVTPQLLAGTLNLIVMKHFDSLLEFIKENHISTSETQINQMFSELFCFYYSLYSFRLGDHLTSHADMNFYGAALLKEARRLLSDSDLPDSIRRWVRQDSYFLPDFDSRFRFYYHNAIPQTEQESIDGIARFCQTEKSNPISYLATKLQFRISTFLRMTPSNRMFIPLWICQSATVIGFTRTLNHTRPVLR